MSKAEFTRAFRRHSIALLLIWTLPALALAHDEKKPDDAAKTPVAINTKCPVSGEDVDVKVVSLFEGKGVGFCCEDCQKKFLKDPTKFKDKIVADAKK